MASAPFVKQVSAVLSGKRLSLSEAEELMDLLFEEPELPAEALAALLGALRYRGETAEELGGFARALRKKSLKMECSLPKVMDTCGTGGDGLNTLNVSTAVAFVLAAAGLFVAKHGNRSVSSRCGSADLLEAAGIALETRPAEVASVLQRDHFVFLYAPQYSPHLKKFSEFRKKLAMRTVFNLLGPLLNPVSLSAQLVGIFDERLLWTYAETLKIGGVRRALVVRGEDGMDEISLTGVTRAVELTEEGVLQEWCLHPEQAGLKVYEPQELEELSEFPERVQHVERILLGQEESPHAELIAANAGAALWMGGLAKNWAEGVQLARSLLRSGTPGELWKKLGRTSVSHV